MSDCTKCPKCGAPHKHSDPDRYHEYKCGSFHWRDCFNEESRCAIRQQAQEELRAQLEAVTKERDELIAKNDESIRLYVLCNRRANWGEITIAEVTQQRDTARAQRDRAMGLLRRANEVKTDTQRFLNWFREVLRLEAQIAKEKEAK